MLRKFRAGIRFFLLLFLMLIFILCLFLTGLVTGVKESRGIWYRRQFCRVILPILGIKIIKKGKTDHKNVLYVSNHRSYIDPFVVTVDLLTLVMAKIEVRSWPIIGFSVAMTGTYFVQREDQSSRNAARERIANKIKEGQSMLIYPEGTTTDLPTPLPFKPRIFHIAAEKEVKIVPIAIEYQDPSDAWVGEDTFIRHFFQVFGKKEIVCEVHYGAPMWVADGVLLREEVQSWIASELTGIRKKWGLPLNRKKAIR